MTTLNLPAGQVSAQGSLEVGGVAPGSFAAAVTGGTGAYRSPHGEMAITSVDADTEVYRLTIVR